MGRKEETIFLMQGRCAAEGRREKTKIIKKRNIFMHFGYAADKGLGDKTK